MIEETTDSQLLQREDQKDVGSVTGKSPIGMATSEVFRLKQIRTRTLRASCRSRCSFFMRGAGGIPLFVLLFYFLFRPLFHQDILDVRSKLAAE